MKVSAIVPTYNSGDFLERCLNALEATGVVDDVTILDGGSSDGTDERAAQRGVRVVRMDGTVLARRLNKGIAEARHESVLVLNDDAFVDPDTPRLLAEVIRERPSVGIAGARLRYDDGRPQRSAGRYKTLAGELLFALAINRIVGRLRPSAVRPEPGTGIEKATWLPLCAAMVRKKAFEDVGGFDDRFAFYSEDQDFARKMTQAGWEIVVRSDAGAVHLAGGSTRRKDPGAWFVKYHQNRFLYLQKYNPRGWRVYALLWAVRASLHMAAWRARAIMCKLRSDPEGEVSARKWVEAFRQSRWPARAGHREER
jgi:N-acetylglucosaminyl-diphospho-decaprenol L-rhamnosyltransferase